VHGSGCGNLKVKMGAGFLDLGDVVVRGLEIVNTAEGRGRGTCSTGRATSGMSVIGMDRGTSMLGCCVACRGSYSGATMPS